MVELRLGTVVRASSLQYDLLLLREAALRRSNRYACFRSAAPVRLIELRTCRVHWVPPSAAT